MDIRKKVLVCALAVATSAFADNTKEETTDSVKQGKDQTLEEVTVVSRKKGMRNLAGAVNGVHIGKEELFKAACCNLGESFTTNPSVDVNYNDAATGARQIKLLGLSGKYVQMLVPMDNSKGHDTYEVYFDDSGRVEKIVGHSTNSGFSGVKYV